MLKELYIHNYRNFVDCTIPFNSDFTLLCGSNGAGKTTIIEVFHKLMAFLTGGFSVESVANEEDYPRWLIKESVQRETTFRICCCIKEYTYIYNLTIVPGLINSIYGSTACRIKTESLTCENKQLFEFNIAKDTSTVYSDDGKALNFLTDKTVSGISLASQKSSKIRNFLEFCNKVTAISLDHDKQERTKDNEKLGFTGNNFKDWYQSDVQKNIYIMSKLIDTYKEFIPNLINIKTDNIRCIFKHDQEYSIYYDELSSGQKRLFIYYYLLYTAEDGAVILIDELENHLSQDELNPLYNMMLRLADDKKIQFIFVSHNPNFLNWYQKNSLFFSVKGNPATVSVEKDLENEL
jgi:AAA15 family ATPase/GTPase